MKAFFLSLCLCFYLSSNSQDKIYLLNGNKIEGLVYEINGENILYSVPSYSREIEISKVVLIEFSNGKTQIFNLSEHDIYTLSDKTLENKPHQKEIGPQNEFYINTLSLVNADLSLSYEYRLTSKKVGIGLQTAYNFNQYATFPNAFIFALSNGKKLYDLSVFANVYSGNKKAKTSIFYGAIVKYTALRFTAVYKDSVYNNSTVSVIVTYKDAVGSQLSALFNLGVQSTLSDQFFIKSSFALGFYRLKGIYKDQFNATFSEPGTTTNISFLPKAYITICVGIKF